MIPKDLKVLVTKESFCDIQDFCLAKGIEWDSSGLVSIEYKDSFLCLYFRAKTNSLQYGKHQYNYDLDIAKEVASDEFKRCIEKIA